MKQSSAFKMALLLLLILHFSFHSFSQTIIFNSSSNWSYLNDGSNQGIAWSATNFSESVWTTNSPATFYFGESLSGTLLTSNPITTYFRKTFSITGLSSYGSFDISIISDDGAIVYVNGVEVGRDNMAAGVVTYTTLASNKNGGGEALSTTINIPACSFVEGTNVIAVEVHQSSASNADMRFSLSLTGQPLSGTPTLTRGPYLQMGSETALSFRWRTSVACYGRVQVGASNGTYTTATADETCPTTEHIIRVTGLTADTKYFYRIGSTTGTVFQGAVDNFFTTVPSASANRKIRIAAFGDCGRNSATYQDENLTNYRNYLTANSIDAPDAWLLLGDNAYTTGTDAEYTTNFFGIYGSNLLKNHKLYPSPGNHDYGNSSSNKYSRTMAYHSNFSTPQNGESGGVASNKQNFYSYDIGNIHFLALDSYGTESDNTDIQTNGTSALKTWINTDLAANTKKWIIAYWHHPPYTKTSHNSDTESDLIAIRQNFIGYLESKGVDMIINGHSHGYERSYLLKNFTGNWNTFTLGTHSVGTSIATYTSNTTCPYVYNSTPANHGTVYVVAGSTGASGGVQTDFDAYAFPNSVNDGGVFYFEVEDNRLDAKMLRRNGTVFDQFTIMKDVNKTQTFNIATGSSITLQASWPSGTNYSWSNAATTRSVTVTPPAGANNYSVTDAYGCVTDNITVNALNTLPVHITKYNVYLNKEKVNIDWTTSQEANSKYFTVARSIDGVQFEHLQTVDATGNSGGLKNYSVVDNAPLKGTSYYRLSQTDIDGAVRFFDVKKIVNVKGKAFDVKVSVSGTMLSVSLFSSQTNKVTLRVFDMAGRVIDTKVWKLSTGFNQEQIRLSRGSYVLSFSAENGETIVQKIVIQ